MTPISATQQFKAIAYLRWRLFANGFRRKGGTGELVARILVFPIAAIILLGVITGSFAAAWKIARVGDYTFLAGVFWVIFALQVLVSINVSPPGLSFDPAQLIRFPLNFPRYLLVRLFLGLLAASNVVGTCALLATAAGVSVGAPRLLPFAFAVAVALALTNMLFTRMVFAWVDRWLSTRRAREFFTFFIVAFSIGIQYVNVTFNGLGKHQSHAQQQAKINAVLHVYHSVEPALHRLPPGLAALAMVHAAAAETLTAIVMLAGVLLYAALFLAVFAWRMQREYRGENLSEANHSPQVEAAPQPRAVPHSSTASSSISGLTATAPGKSLFSPAVSALLGKEWTYVRRNPAQFYGLLAPLAMVFLFAARMGRFGSPGIVFPAAAAYSSLGLAALAYNILGLDANGVQFYFLAPVRFHTIFLAKNLFGFAIAGVQFLLLFTLITFTRGLPGALITVSVLCWIVFATLVNVTVGNIRSITAPKKIDPAKISRRQASQLSALIALAIMLVIIGLGAGTLLLASVLAMPWLPVPVFLILAGAAFGVYWSQLGQVDARAAAHRETLIEELSKTE